MKVTYYNLHSKTLHTREISVREHLLEGQIVTFEVKDGMIEVQEQCDGHYTTLLTPDSIRDLARELLALADEAECRTEEGGS